MIKCLNKYGEEVRPIDFIELQWNRKYYDCGSFVLYIAAKDYNPKVKYIQNIGRPETGMVEKVVYEQKPNGNFVTISGRFIDLVLDWGFMQMPLTIEYKGKDVVKRRLKEWLYTTFSCPDKPGASYEPQWIYGAPTTYDVDIDSESDIPNHLSISAPLGVTTGEAMRKSLQLENYAYTCFPIFNQDRSKEAEEPLLGVSVKTWKGRDLRDKIFFGDAVGNVSKIEYVVDESAIRSAYFVNLEVPENYKPINHSYFIGGEEKRAIDETFIDHVNIPTGLGFCRPAKLITPTLDGIEIKTESNAQIRAKMCEAAKLDMLNQYRLEHISVDVLQNRFFYLQDYDLGDICTINIESIEKEFISRLIEVREVHAKNKVDVELVFGTPYKQKYRKVEL